MAATPRQVGSVAAVVSSVLGVTDASTVTVTTSEQLAQLRATVGHQLGGFGQGLVESVFAATAVIVAAILSALVLLRRRDFGRRRALGASRSLIVQLLLTQVGLQAVAGSILGCVTTSLVLTAQDAPLPPPAFFAALALLAVVTALAAAAVPALIASRRDPLRELRVP
ncbi:FtsX-like permease family protein [Subtercola sp. RTI3]|uniref:FtsX-like permease family protein n=1 Tax=Subtercola sp. RTI3 TaxID=3048639 RepID=UPI002B226B4C|nr:FtsX-like permease family protein [Subtercola sp. RTI3]MEA9986014.1 hypothetical protein [Subtercola sp. RTI3]